MAGSGRLERRMRRRRLNDGVGLSIKEGVRMADGGRRK